MTWVLRQATPRRFRPVGAAGSAAPWLGLASAALLACGCDPFHTQFEAVEDAQLYEAAQKTAAAGDETQLRVMTWNIKFAGGRIRFFFECGGERGWMSRAEVEANLGALAAKIRQAEPDIVLLQEVDTESKRCAYVDNLQWLLDHTHLSYGAYGSQWRADYVPSDGVGRIDSGNAILSRWPLLDAQRIALPLIGDQDAVTRYFYLKRNILRARVGLPRSRPLWIMNTHTSAFSDDGTKKKQIDELVEQMHRHDQAGDLIVAGGDLNALPPGATKLHDFPDDCGDDGPYSGDDYRGEEDWLAPLYESLVPAVALDDYQQDGAPHQTFTGDEHVFWSRKLDYLFTNGRFVAGATMTHQSIERGAVDTLPLSDHAPVTTVLDLTEP